MVNEQYVKDKYGDQVNFESGFYTQSINSLIKQGPKNLEADVFSSFRLGNAIGGHSKFMSYFKEEDRIIYQSDFQTIRIVPVLHRNTISTLGMRNWKYYQAIRRFDDQIVALDSTQRLTTYSLMTGKFVKAVKIPTDLGL